MKELSIEEKAKAYDEAYKKVAVRFGSNVADEIFPELKESEDERIKKAIKYGLDYVFTNNTTVYETTKEQCLAWLEKQGNLMKALQISNAKIGELIEKNYYLKEQLEKQGEQKPVEPQQDMLSQEKYAKAVDECIYGEQKPAWSEEDEKCIRLSTDIIDSSLRAGFCVQLDRDRCVDWLKSLRPQNRWKPSDEQMIALRQVISGCSYDIEPLLELETKLKEF